MSSPQTLPEDVRRAAARWWADHLRRDADPVAAVTADFAAAFEAALVDRLASPSFCGHLTVDYLPDRFLAAACSAAAAFSPGGGTTAGSLPRRTVMSVAAHRVRVWTVGGEWQTLYSAPPTPSEETPTVDGYKGVEGTP